MLQCGLVRSNFSLAIVLTFGPALRGRHCCEKLGPAGSRAGWVYQISVLTEERSSQDRVRYHKPSGTGAGSRDRTGILSLEGCCTTIVLYPPTMRGLGGSSPRSAYPLAGYGTHVRRQRPARGGGSRTRTYEGVRQGIYSPPPLPLGTFPRALGRPSMPCPRSAVQSENQKNRL